MATRKKTARRAPKSTSRHGSSGGGNPNNDGRITEEQHEDAMRVLRAEYYQGVRSIAEDLARRVKEGEIRDAEALEEAINQDVDGSYWVIYTHANLQVLLISNHDAYSEEFGQAPVEGNDINWAAAAFATLQRDVRDQVEAEGIEFGGGDLDERRGRLRTPRGGMSRDTIERLADRAAEDGEHSVVDACQVLLRSTSSPEDRAQALRVVRAYERELSEVRESRGPRGLRAGRRH